VLHLGAFYTDADVLWFGPDGRTPRWDDPREKRLGCAVRHRTDELCLLFNASTEKTGFVLPPGRWSCAIDTAHVSSSAEALEPSRSHDLEPCSSAVLYRPA
jgi:glycogen operon protein